jgi:hypothetical protein
MSFTNRITWETLRSIDSANLNGTYQALGGPLLHQGYIVKMVNNGPSVVTVSIDGATDIDVCPGNSFWLYDEGKMGNQAGFPSLPQGTQFYVKGAASGTTPGLSLIYLVVQYLILN